MELGKLSATTRGETIRFDLRPGRPLTLGRSSRCTVVVRDPKMSREHCRLEIVNGKLRVTDLASSHGLTYRGQTTAGFEIDVGDGFHVGQTFIRFETREKEVAEERGAAAALPQSQSSPPPPQADEKALVEAELGESLNELGVGAELGGFVIEAVLGRSDRCTVYQAHQVQLNRRVALKVLRRPAQGSHSAHERMLFLEDARTAASIADPLLVQVFDIGQTGEDCFAALELVKGQCLAERIDHGRCMTWAELVPVLIDVLQALETVHQLGRVHAAVKPANVFLLDRGGSKLADPRSTARPRSTEEPCFSAPEQLSRHPVDARTDLYALGLVAYAALAGRPPFLGSARRIAEAQQRGAPESLLAIDRTIPDALDELILDRLLAKDPAHRPATALEVRDELLALHDVGARPAAVAASVAAAAAPPEPQVEYPTIPVPGRVQARPVRRQRNAAPSLVFQLFGQLVLYVMILIAGAAVALALKHKNPDYDIYRLLDYLRPPDATTAPR
ncbi:MAG TPA: FHA domain-containing serine/threonine-protein kinase [Planctomycetota bacterium]